MKVYKTLMPQKIQEEIASQFSRVRHSSNLDLFIKANIALYFLYMVSLVVERVI